MIECRIGKIEEFEADAIVNASNGIGYMGGLLGRFIRLEGVAESLHYVSKGKIEKEAKQVVKTMIIQPGTVFDTSAGGLKAKRIFHAVTMNKPGQKSSLDIVEKCLKEIINYSHCFQFQTVSIPALGTGTGRVSKKEVARLYYQYLTRESIKFIVIDPSGEFNGYIQEYVESSYDRNVS